MASPSDQKEWRNIPDPYTNNTVKEQIAEREPFKEPTYKMLMNTANFELFVRAIEDCGGKLAIPEAPRDPYGGKYARRNHV